MATKTLILRPISATTTKIGTFNKASTSVTPSDTAADAYHTLLAEESPDNDATYIMIKGGYCIDVKFDVLPQDIQISNIKIIVVASTSSNTTNENVLTYEFYKTVNGTQQIIDSLQTDASLLDLSSGYTRLVCESSLFTQELSTTSSLDYIFRFQTPQVNTAVNVTQIYAEVVYEVSNSTIIHYHENGAWSAVPCKIYQKINNAWKESGKNVFVEGEMFNLNSL
jgi:hypothetical protein